MTSPSPPVDATPEEGAIRDTAERARVLLLCCRGIADEEPRKLASTQLARFNLWASNIGVFAARHASLDYRLRTALSVRVAVEGNLDLVCKHLLTALKASPDLSEDEFNALFDAPRSRVSAVAEDLLLNSPSDAQARTRELELVEARISILHQLSLAIRRASNRNILAKVPALVDLDNDYVIIRERRQDRAGSQTLIDRVLFDIGAGFEEFVRKTLTARWLRLRSSIEGDLDQEQPNYRDTLLERCVATVSVRRRQLAYFQAHQKHLEQSNRDGSASRPWQPHLGVITAPQDALQPAEDPGCSRPPGFSIEPLDATQEETVGSEFVMDKYKPPPASSAPSSSLSTTFGGGGPFEAPPPPKLAGNEREKACPYCCLVLPATTFSTQNNARKWKRHLVEDLQPYICLFTNCSAPGKTYSCFGAWQTHLSEPHYHSWRCPLHPEDGSGNTVDQDESLTFDTVAKFKTHLRIYHPALDPSFAEDSFRHGHRLAALPRWCFVCLEAPIAPDRLLLHMVGHFQSMSLLALPWRDDLDMIDEEARLSNKVATSSSAASNNNNNKNIDDDDNDDDWLADIREETVQAPVTEPASERETQAVVVSQPPSAVGVSAPSVTRNEDRVWGLEMWVRDRGLEVETRSRARKKWRLALRFAAAVARLHLGARWKQEQSVLLQTVWAEAELVEVQEMEMRMRVLGAEHPATLKSIAHLASMSWIQGRWEEAGKREAQEMERRMNALGPGHPDTLQSVSNLALARQHQGRWKAAEGLFLWVTETSSTRLGHDHPRALASRSNLATMYRNQGRCAEAETLFSQLIETREAKLGADHPETLTSVADLAATYRRQGRWEAAERLFRRVMETRKAILGADDPDTLRVANDLGLIYRSQGRFPEAEALFVQLVSSSTARLGADHPDTLRGISNLALTLQDRGRHAEALALMEDCAQAQKRVLGAEHPFTISSFATLAKWKGV